MGITGQMIGGLAGRESVIGSRLICAKRLECVQLAGAVVRRRVESGSKLRVGDYRILYWIYPAKKLVRIYRIQHRSEVYRSL
jgi:mRNA-degrading endonuclease RelE of RelBE toxin-antitoxin system